jgi:hypothetical protein
MAMKVSKKTAVDMVIAVASAMTTILGMRNKRKNNHSEDPIATVENMLVRLEKKIQENRTTVEVFRQRMYVGWSINFVLLIVILLKVFGIF